MGVVVTDVLPAGLTYIADTARRRGEDRNYNDRLDAGEDINGNGVLWNDENGNGAVDHRTELTTYVAFSWADQQAEHAAHEQSADHDDDERQTAGVVDLVDDQLKTLDKHTRRMAKKFQEK